MSNVSASHIDSTSASNNSQNNCVVKNSKKRKHNNKSRSNRSSSLHQPSRFYFDKQDQALPILSDFIPTSSGTQTSMRTFSQPTLQRHHIFKDQMAHKEDGVCRIVSQNIGCLGVQAYGNNKLRAAKEWLFHNQVDICGWQEIGFANHNFKRHERMAERMRDSQWPSMMISTGTNKNEELIRFQWRGTCVMSFGLLAHMTKSSGVDDTGLGRWSWLLLEGHRGVQIRIISAYNPCKTKSSQTSTVYSQHRRYFLNRNQDVCPRLQFRPDLCQFISTCQQASEDIILMMDCNP